MCSSDLVGTKRELSLDEIKTLFADINLKWPENRDELAMQRSNKAKHESIRNQKFGGKSSAKTSSSQSAHKDKNSIKKDKKSVWNKGKKKR